MTAKTHPAAKKNVVAVKNLPYGNQYLNMWKAQCHFESTRYQGRDKLIFPINFYWILFIIQLCDDISPKVLPNSIQNVLDYFSTL